MQNWNPSRAGRDAGFSISAEKAAHKVAKELSTILETYIDPYDLSLYSAVGYWAHMHQDVMRFTGSFARPDLPRLSYSVGSWSLTLSAIASGKKFIVHDERGEQNAYADFEIEDD